MGKRSFSIDEALIKAKKFKKKGDFDQARKIYQSIIVTFPKNSRVQNALLDLSSEKIVPEDLKPSQDITKQLINLFDKKEFKTIVAKANYLTSQFPNNYVILNILGVSYISIKKYNEAVNVFKYVINLNPENVDGHYNMALAYHGHGKLEEAIVYYKNALSIDPKNIKAYYNIALAFQNQGKLNESINAYKSAISLNPNFAEAYNNMGLAYQKQMKLDDAVDAYNKALTLNPSFAEAYNNKGLAFQEQGELLESSKNFKIALSINSNYSEANNNMGLSLQGQGRHKDALEYYKTALIGKPEYADAYYNIANTFKDLSNRKIAIENYENVLRYKSDYELARAQKLHQQSHICDWEKIKEDNKFISTLGIQKQYIDPFTLLNLEDEPKRHRLRSEIYSSAKHIHEEKLFKIKVSKSNDYIRVGYFSADFKEHPVAYLIARMLELHNRKKFKIYAFSYGINKNDKMRDRISDAVDVFYDVCDKSNKEVALLARQNKIDIAIDLNGYTDNARTNIFAYRAAPIQVNFLGYPGTLGAKFIDYIIADKKLIPYENKKYFSEKIIYLPNSYMPTDNTRAISNKIPSRSDMGLPEGSFVFCCFNNNYKIMSSEFDIWMRVLKKVKKSVLWLRKPDFYAEDNLKNEAKKRNIDPSRLIFASKVNMEVHITRHKLADLFLDTFNFNAHTTASEALWAGLPIVTKIGKGFAARVASSLLCAIDLPELITTTNQQYETLILELATNQNKLNAIKQKLEINRLKKALFNSALYTGYIENGYKQAYLNYFEGNKPQTIYVPR